VIVTGRSYDEILNTGANFVDADGNTGWVRYVVASLDFVETVSP
jgi:hypothetical protein